MGKIRVSTLGDLEAEKKQKEEAKQRRLAKKVAKEGTKAAEKSEDKKETKKSVKETKKPEVKETEIKTEQPKKLASKPKKEAARIRSSRYKEIRTLVDTKKLYSIDEALNLVKQTAKTKFTGSVEAHFNLSRVVKLKNIDGVKAERKSPLVHAKLGKTTDSDSTLKEKLDQAIKAVGSPNIKKLVLNATMGPGIKVTL